jgi:hypothetical protein
MARTKVSYSSAAMMSRIFSEFQLASSATSMRHWAEDPRAAPYNMVKRPEPIRYHTEMRWRRIDGM